MKKLFFLLLLSSSLYPALYSQEVIIGAPLSVEEEPGRQLKMDEPVGALVPAEATINPLDGQIKLDPVINSKEEKEAKKQDEKVISPVTPAQIAETFFVPQKFLQFSFGYLNSKWEKIHPNLDNGSVLTDFKVVSDMNKNVQLGFAVEIINDTSEQTLPDNIRVLQYKVFTDVHGPLFQDRLDWLAGLGLSIGDYSVRRLSRNALGEEVNTKIKSGTIYGLIPTAGVRFYLVDRNSIDLALEYHQYFSTPQRHISGLAFVPRFSFLF